MIFWRTVVEVEGDTLTLDVPLRYPAKLRDQASVRRVDGYLREVGVEGIGLANAVGWDDAWSQDQVRALSLRGVKDAWVRDVGSFVSPGAPAAGLGMGRHLQSSGIEVLRSKRVTVADSSLALAQHRGDGGNGYLFEVSQSSEILIRDCVGTAGRHNFIQNWGFGNVGTVFLRCVSSGGGQTTQSAPNPSATLYSEHHHSLAMATLVDDSRFDDGWASMNRGSMSTGAGHTSTGSVVWRAAGTGKVISRNFGWGYVIGTKKGVSVDTNVDVATGAGTLPEDFVEKKDEGDALFPSSLYEHQRVLRLAGAAK
jgi:hypothetical protein